MTGIDRVEFTYLSHLLGEAPPLFGLVRSRVGWLLLDRAGCEKLFLVARGDLPMRRPDLLSRLIHRKNPLRASAESTARALAVARAARPGLARLLRRLPAGTTYLNVGHANLTRSGLACLRKAGLTTAVMIHDTIPLDHPSFARPGTVEPFRKKLAAVSAEAACVIHISHAARRLTEAHMAKAGRVPPGLVAWNGVTQVHPDVSALPPGLDLSTPFFVTLGTIEPRKNHHLLLDVWGQLGPRAPRLFIVGSRGWADSALLDRLDALPEGGPVRELGGLSDGAVAALLARATALLAPSLAEGFGLPVLEAASLGTPVVAADLEVTRELLGDKAVYLSPFDSYSWMETIERLSITGSTATQPLIEWQPPTWQDHFKTVLRSV